jgi:hypothetical protein
LSFRTNVRNLKAELKISPVGRNDNSSVYSFASNGIFYS